MTAFLRSSSKSKWSWKKTANSELQLIVSAVVISVLMITVLPRDLRAQSLLHNDGPNMSGNNDPTGGLKFLLVNDDLVMVQVSKGSGNNVSTSLLTMDTSNSTVPNAPQTTAINTTDASGAFNRNSGVLAAQAVGRMFNTKSDIAAVLNAGDATGGKTWSFTLIDPLTKFQLTTALNSQFRPSGTIFTQVVMGDFNGDKLADPLVIYSSVASNGSTEWGMQVLTAADPNMEAAPKEGPELFGSSAAGLVPVNGAIAVGDFNGDGLDEIAVLQSDQQTILFYSVDPKSLTITPISVTPTVKLPFPMVVGQVALAAGRFRAVSNAATGITNADLVAFGQISKKVDGYSVIPILITPQSGGSFTAAVVQMSNATNDKPFFRFPDFHEAYGALAQAAPLIYFPQEALQQLVLGIRTHDGAGYIQIGSFALDNELDQFEWESQTELNAAENGTDLINMAVGNFDNQNSDGTHDAEWQIEAFTMEDSGVRHVRIYDVNSPPPVPPPNPPPPYGPPPNPPKPDDWLKQKTNFNFGKDSDFLLGVVLPGDIQGRSLRLGAPTIVRIVSQIQPDLVLAVPPMHVDWLVPSGIVPHLLSSTCQKNLTKPCVLNLTVQPSVEPSKGTPFTSSFTSTSTTTQKSKKSATTSWGISLKESVGGSATFNDGFENASASVKNTTSTTHNQTVASTYDSYTGSTNTLTATTGFADYIFFTSKGMNVYYYPVLGNQIPCPINDLNCSVNQSFPAYVEFSVPDNITYTDSDGTTQDWYQPVHEPGNVLSYPWNKAQLQAQFTDKVVPLTQDPPSCSLIGTSTQTSTTTWTNGSTSDQSSGTTNTFSDDASMSYSEGAGVSGVDAADFNFSLDLGVNTSLKTLNESISSVSSSQGITVNQPAFPLGECCSYGLGGYIFGQVSTNHPSGQLACKPGQTSGCLPVNDPNKKQTDIASTGPLFSGFIADVIPDSFGLSCGSGGDSNWWGNEYTQPDIALNHPLRWSWDKTTSIVTLNAPSQNETALGQPFYQMRGFFITKPVVKGSSSPNLARATIGDDLVLTTRVYNYSLTPTPQNDIVHVRFYGQLFCHSQNGNESSCSNPSGGICADYSLCGNSFEIGETTIASIPGFKSSIEAGEADLPNWTTTSIDFPTSKFISAQGNAYMVFWVVVWMQDSNGNLVPEMTDHGLASIPGKLLQATDVPIESYSNNVGMYGMNSQFYIAPKTAPGSVETTGSLKKLTVLTTKRIMLNQRTAVTANLTATGGSGESVTIAYFDGNPSKNGTLLDVQHIQHMDAEIPYTHRVFFNPDSCGVHTLYAQAWIPNSQAIQSSFTTDVIIQPTDRVKQLRAATESTNFKDRQVRQELLILLDVALEGYRIDPDSILGSTLLKTYVKKLKSASGKDVTAEAANLLIDQANIIAGCTKRFD